MKVLLIGSGGREHALAWKLAQSARLSKLFVAPGNAGTGSTGENVALDVTDHQGIVNFCIEQNIGLVVVGPEAPLVDGLADALGDAEITVFGPGRDAARLEGSKAFTKALCDRMKIPTAGYASFEALAPALDYVRAKGAPLVIKADGLAAGKGVTMAQSLEEAETALEECFSGQFGEAGAAVVIEEWLVGEEASVFALCDGTHFKLMATAQDHKRAFDGDKGPNTGGMGAYSPAPVVTQKILEEIGARIIAPTLAGMRDLGAPFSGVLYAGLMITEDGPKLIEYNVRFGDPETQVLMMRLSSDLLDALYAAATGTLDGLELEWSDDAALTVVMAAKGYPGAYEKGTAISGIEAASVDPDVEVFHAGTALKDGALVANGGRVLNVTARGQNIAQAQARAYEAVEKITWAEGFWRHDIGWRAIEKQG